MIQHMGWFLWLLVTVSCRAAEIVAWKGPLSHFAGCGLETPGLVRCNAAPEVSPFFKDGDILWDLKGISIANRFVTSPPLEWVVWNESSGRLVIKADWNGVWQLNQRFEMEKLPKQCRLTAEVFEVPADGLPLSESSIPLMVLSWVSGSSQEFEAVYQQDGKRMRAKGSATISETDPVVDSSLEMSIAVPDQAGLEINTRIIVPSGASIWAARDFDGTKGMDLRISSVIELTDGTPVSQAMMIQKGDSALPLIAKRSRMKRRIGDKGWLISQWLDARHLVYSWSTETSVDPFAKEDREIQPKPHCFKDAVVPEILRPWFDRPVWDLREWTRNQGLELRDGSDFVGYDPLTQRVFIYSESELLLDMFEQLYSPICIHRPAMLAATFDGFGQSRLVSCSGQISRMKRTLDGKMEVRLLEIEPTVGDTGELVSFRVDYHDEFTDGKKQSIKTAVTLKTGCGLDLISSGAGDKKKPTLSVKAELVEDP